MRAKTGLQGDSRFPFRPALPELLGAAAIALAACAFSFTAFAEPRLAVDSEVFDFGAYENIKPAAFHFTLTNAGDDTLVFSGVKSSCGCATPTLKAAVLSPGEHTELTGSINLPGKSGPIEKTLTVLSNDPAAPMKTLTLTGTFERYIQAQPDRLQRVWSKDASTIAQDVRVVATKEGPSFKVTDLRVDAKGAAGKLDGVDLSIEPVVEGREYRIHVLVHIPANAGSITGVLRIATDHADYAALALPLRVTPPVVVEPEFIQLRASDDNAQATVYRVQLSLAPSIEPQQGTFQTLGFFAPAPEIAVSIKALAPDRKLLEFTGLSYDAALDGQAILIKTDVPGAEEIRVPIRMNK